MVLVEDRNTSIVDLKPPMVQTVAVPTGRTEPATAEERTLKRSLLALTTLITLVVGLFAFTATPAQAQYDGPCGLILNPPEIAADTATSIEVSGVCCPAASIADIFVVVDGQEVFVGTAQVANDTDGGFNQVVTIPPLPAGEYSVVVHCGPVTLSAVLTVVGTTTVTTGALPRTGSDPWTFIRIAVLLVAIGGFLLLFTRKRRQELA
jgi:LPXTG-motif cell wall-anchored protein